MRYLYHYTALSKKTELLEAFKGKKLSELPTPSFIVDRGKFKENCEKMLANADRLNVDFRAHVKTQKTVEGTLLQLGSENIKTKKSSFLRSWRRGACCYLLRKV